jgi:hypothetical protein
MRFVRPPMHIFSRVHMVLPIHSARYFLGPHTRTSFALATTLGSSLSSHDLPLEARLVVRIHSTKVSRTRAMSESTATPVRSLLFISECSQTHLTQAVTMCETFVSSAPPADGSGPRPFVYISAEDIFRPLIPSGYITSKREAERLIIAIANKQPNFRPVFIRPSESRRLL